MRKKILIIVLGLIAIFLAAVVYKSINIIINSSKVNSINESSVDSESEEQYGEISSSVNNAIIFGEYLHYLINEQWHWYDFEEYFSEGFMNKYKYGEDIFSELKNAKRIEISGSRTLNDKGDEIEIELRWEKQNAIKCLARVVYKLALNNDGKIDNCEFISSTYYDPITFNPLDGRPISLHVEDARGFISVLFRPNYYRNHEDGDSYYDMYINIPKSDDCQIINQPKEPYKCDNCFPYLKAMYCNPNMEIIDTKYYKVDYSTNDKAQFTKIEFIELTEEDYNKALGL